MSAPFSDRIVSGCASCTAATRSVKSPDNAPAPVPDRFVSGCVLCPGAPYAQGAPHTQPQRARQKTLQQGCSRKVWRGETGVVPSLGLPCRTDNASRHWRTPPSSAVICAAAGQRINRCGSAPWKKQTGQTHPPHKARLRRAARASTRRSPNARPGD